MCPDCGGSRLRAGGAVDHGSAERIWPKWCGMNIAEAQAFFDCRSSCAGRNGDRRQDPGRNSAAAEIPERCGARISDARPAVGDAFGRRSAAHPAGDVPGFAAGGRVLCARRAFHRPAQPRYGRLIGILEELRDLGNTIVVVEHDPDVMRSADHIVDMGPGAGENGGRIVFEGDYKKLIAGGHFAHVASICGAICRLRYISGRRKLQPQANRPIPGRAGA